MIPALSERHKFPLLTPKESVQQQLDPVQIQHLESKQYKKSYKHIESNLYDDQYCAQGYIINRNGIYKLIQKRQKEQQGQGET